MDKSDEIIERLRTAPLSTMEQIEFLKALSIHRIANKLDELTYVYEADPKEPNYNDGTSWLRIKKY